MQSLRTLALAILLAVAASHANAQEFRMLSSWDRNHPLAPVVLNPFMKGVEAASKGRIKFIVNGPETVAAFEQLQPVASGVFQFLFSSGAYHFGTTPILMLVDALHGDPATVHASGIFEFIDNHYQKFGMKLVALPMTPEGGYIVILRQPIGPSGDLAGRKIRSTPTYLPVIKMLGGIGVVLAQSDVYTALEKGTVDGSTTPILNVLDYRWNEVTKYMLRPAFGTSSYPLLMNRGVWNKLSEADRQIIMTEGRKVEEAWYREAPRMWAEAEKAMIAKGMTITQMGAAQKAKLQTVWEDGMFELGATKNAKDVAQMRQIARSKGLIR